MAIRTTTTDDNYLLFEIDGKGGKASAKLTGMGAISLRNRIDRLIVNLVDKAVDDGELIDDVLNV